jgi:hypothetical protein
MCHRLDVLFSNMREEVSDGDILIGMIHGDPNEG